MIVDRILQILNNKHITKYKFCKDLGVSNGFLDKTREITTDKCANILTYFPDINPDWLLTGKGSMLREKPDKSTNQSIVGSNINNGMAIVGNVRGNNSGNINSNVDVRQYYSDSPDVLRARIKEKDLLLAEKDERIRELISEKEELKQALKDVKK
jgi:hypothetical protein